MVWVCVLHMFIYCMSTCAVLAATVTNCDLEHTGSKPIPSAVHLGNHFHFPFKPQEKVADKGGEAIYPFVR